jgi:hypothetical protein
MKQQQIKERFKGYNRRLIMLLKSEISVKNKTAAIRALSGPLLWYSFGTINWRLQEIRKINRKIRNVLIIRNILIIYKMHHPKAKLEYM